MLLSTYFLFGTAVAVLFALLEVQIEGKNGWAAQLPTWRWYRPWFRFLGSDKPLTGYHVYVWLLLITLLHTPFLFIPWGLKSEFILLSLYLFILRLEDFLWFIFNPYYGWRKFSPKYIPWHTHWWGPIPVTYYTSVFFWLLLFLGGMSGRLGL